MCIVVSLGKQYNFVSRKRGTDTRLFNRICERSETSLPYWYKPLPKKTGQIKSTLERFRKLGIIQPPRMKDGKIYVKPTPFALRLYEAAGELT